VENTSDIRKYNDIIGLPHHTSSKRARMSISDRAAQFSPFAALNGYDAAIQETGRFTEEKIELDESNKSVINEKLWIVMERLSERPEITITYFQPDDRKAGGTYVSVTGYVKKIDEYERTVVMADGTNIIIERIITITGDIF
jgi:hypothetical protein